jgi:hypothetical protein
MGWEAAWGGKRAGLVAPAWYRPEDEAILPAWYITSTGESTRGHEATSGSGPVALEVVLKLVKSKYLKFGNFN